MCACSVYICIYDFFLKMVDLDSLRCKVLQPLQSVSIHNVFKAHLMS